jgi:large conductance mechanosensitive channel
MAKKKSTFGADFKKFISRGNVVDMAVGVVVGGAFSKIVTGFVNYVINPFVALFLPAGSLDEIKTVTKEAVVEVVDGVETVVTPEAAILWGTWLQTIIDFLIIAFCIFCVVRVINKVREKATEKETLAKAEADAAAAAAAAEKAAAEAEAAKAKAEEEAAFRASIMKQTELLAEISKSLKK